MGTLVLGPAIPILIWDGAVNRPISVLVLDSAEGHAISGATVTLEMPHDQDLAAQLSKQEMTEYLTETKRLANSDDRGQATLRGEFGAGGHKSAFGRTGTFGVEGFLRVSHPDYRTSEDLLQNYLGERRFSIGKMDLSIRIYLVHRPGKVS